MQLRLLNENGLIRWRETLEESRRLGQPVWKIPRGLLTDERASSAAPVTVEVPERSFATAWEAAECLARVLSPVPAALLESADGRGNPGLWGWLTLFYFDTLCPSVPNALYRYIPETTGSTAGLRYYRHLLAGPYRLYQQLGEHARPALESPPWEHNTLYLALENHFDLIQNPGLAEAMNVLYTDRATGRMRRGATRADAPGSLPRFFHVLAQLELTYDLLGMTADDLLELLPGEFRTH